MTTPSWLDRSAWPFASGSVAVGGARLHYVDQGQGPTVVLVHGTPTWSFEWRHVIAALSQRARVIALDHLGFGLSDRPADAGYRPEDHAVRFRAFMEAVCPSGPVTLVVHDFGGPIALDWALDHPDRLAQLVVVNSWMWSFADEPSMARKARLAGGLVARWLYRRCNASLTLIMPAAYSDRRRLTSEIHAQYLQVFPDPDGRERVLFALARSLAGSSAYFDGLWQRRAALGKVDVTLVWGMRDPVFPPSMLARWRRAFPRANVVELADAGHWPHEEAPEACTRALDAVVGASTIAARAGRHHPPASLPGG